MYALVLLGHFQNNTLYCSSKYGEMKHHLYPFRVSDWTWELTGERQIALKKKKDLFFVWKAKLQSEGKRDAERERSFICWLTPNDSKGGGKARLKPGAGDPLWTAHVSGRGPSIKAIFHSFSRKIPKVLNGKWSSQNSNQLFYGMSAF